MKDILTFKKMITPGIIQVLFWGLVAICVYLGIKQILGAIEILSATDDGRVARFRAPGLIRLRLVTGVVWLLLGPIAVRIWCETLILAFRIYDTLTDISRKMRDTISW